MQALFGCIFLNVKKEKQISDFVLIGLFFVFLTYLSTFYYIYNDVRYAIVPYILVQPLFFLVGPAIYIYTDLLISSKQRIKKSYYLHLIPFVASYIIDLAYFGIVGFDKLTFAYYDSLIYTKLVFVIRIFLPIVYAIGVVEKVNKHQEHIKEEYSFSEKIDLGWLKYLCYGLIVIGLSGIAFIIFESVLNIKLKHGFNYYILVSISLYVFYLSYFSFKQKSIIYKVSENNGEIHYSTNSVLVEKKVKTAAIHSKIAIKNITENSLKNRRNMEELKIYEKRLYNAMQQNKLFLEPELSLAQLASNLNITSHLLSQVLNECIMMNFYDFVNSYRVLEMKTKLANRSFDKYNIVVLAYESGFNSKASFQRIFKNHTGLTPTEYKKDLIQKEAEEYKEMELCASLV